MALEDFTQSCNVNQHHIFKRVGPSLWALLRLLSCGWSVTNNLAHVPHFAALPRKAKTTLMVISREGSGSKMDFSADTFIFLRIRVSKAGTDWNLHLFILGCVDVRQSHSKYRVLVMSESAPLRNYWPSLSTASSLYPSCLPPPRPHSCWLFVYPLI